MASNGVTRPPALDVTMQEILDALKAVSFRPQVIDNLTSQDSGAPLSANQGRVLKDAIDDIVTQSITDGDTSHAPSGDAVHDAINAINTDVGSLVSKVNGVVVKKRTIVYESPLTLRLPQTGSTGLLLMSRDNDFSNGAFILHCGTSDVGHPIVKEIEKGSWISYSFISGSTTRVTFSNSSIYPISCTLVDFYGDIEIV